MTSFTITKPDDWHVHLRDGAMLEAVLPYTARQFGRAVVMPNLMPPVVSVEMAMDYHNCINSSLRAERGNPRNNVLDCRVASAPRNDELFKPVMTLYLTDDTKAEEITKAAQTNFIKAVKLYPAGATTNSGSGVTDIKNIYKVLEACQKYGILLLIHGEVTDKNVDIFDREAVFIERILVKVTKDFPNLKIVLEHITTKQGVDFITAAPKNIAATITPQHLLLNRNDLLVGGIRPHYYCLPILKAEEHRKALVQAALSDSGKFFAGTDSAPHLQGKKETGCGCAGCFSAPIAVELYAECFDRAEDLSLTTTQTKFENFMSKFGAKFYNLPFNNQKITLTKSKQQIPQKIATKDGDIIPLMAGESLNWTFENA